MHAQVGYGRGCGCSAADPSARSGANVRTIFSPVRVEPGGNPDNASDNDNYCETSRAGYFLHSALYAARPGIGD